ncbi:unnamed protein product [Prorocentrum cordatum]|uniref:Uncharacterized protein n=1 Tax=Prorocentrum cordatum TaxID=2364126 RepID=A0ABN9VLD7_9DINO|nr:unnamed protein product [Polarella glacialis]
MGAGHARGAHWSSFASHAADEHPREDHFAAGAGLFLRRPLDSECGVPIPRRCRASRSAAHIGSFLSSKTAGGAPVVKIRNEDVDGKCFDGAGMNHVNSIRYFMDRGTNDEPLSMPGKDKGYYVLPGPIPAVIYEDTPSCPTGTSRIHYVGPDFARYPPVQPQWSRFGLTNGTEKEPGLERLHTYHAVTAIDPPFVLDAMRWAMKNDKCFKTPTGAMVLTWQVANNNRGKTCQPDMDADPIPTATLSTN